MTNVFILCMTLIQRGMTKGLIDKLDVYLANDRLTVEEYSELLAMLESND